MTEFSIDQLQALLKTVTDFMGDSPLDQALEDRLNAKFHADSDTVKAITAACHSGIDAGALCQHEAGGIKFGRAIKPTSELGGCSVDVVYMNNVKGPYHVHPRGEIDLLIPIAADAKFDGRSCPWQVNGAGSQHAPTVTDGDALVLYLLPNGEIEFTRST